MRGGPVVTGIGFRDRWSNARHGLPSRGNLLAAAAALALLMGGAAGSPAVAQTSIEARAASLAPGQFVWRDDLAASGPVAIVVSLPQQLAFVYRDGTLVGVSTVSTGKRGKRTPTGAFTILQKKVFHRSNLYSNAPMPYMQRLTWTGIAMHAGDLPGYPASHGCIRFPAAFAKRLYAATDLGGEVRIVATPIAPAPPRAVDAPVRIASAPKPKPPPALPAAPAVAMQAHADDRVTASEAASPQIALAAADAAFAAYDVAVAEGYGAKGGRR